MVTGRLELAATLKGPQCFSKVPGATSKLELRPLLLLDRPPLLPKHIDLAAWPRSCIPTTTSSGISSGTDSVLRTVPTDSPSLTPICNLRASITSIQPISLPLSVAPDSCFPFFTLLSSSVTLGSLVLLHARASSSASFKRRSFPSVTAQSAFSLSIPSILPCSPHTQTRMTLQLWTPALGPPTVPRAVSPS